MKHVGRLALLAAVLGVLLSQAVPAFAAPAPGYEAFAGCPDQPDVFACVRSDTKAGSIQIGSTNTPINKTIVLSGGVNAEGHFVYNSQGGLIAPPLNVPGGLSGLTGLSEFLINILTLGAHQVQAQAILVGEPVLNPFAPGALEMVLPIRVRLINPFLTSTCSIGSAANPITLKLTTGTTSPPPPNKPISGTINPINPFPGLPGVGIAEDLVFVDNAFAAPTATGCDLLGFGLLNGLVNTRVGLPSAAGRNTAIMGDTTLLFGNADFIYP
jgi:hypothetical protein